MKRLSALVRLKPFDTSTEAGRSRERFRRAGMTTLSAGGARAIGMLASLVTVPLTFRYLGPERYGLWMVLISIIGAMSFADLGIGLGLINAISEAHAREDHDLAREYVTSAFVMLLGIAVFLTLAAVVAGPFLPWMRLFNVKSAAVGAEGAQAFIILYGWFVVSIPLGVISRVQSGFQQGYIPQAVAAVSSVATLAALLAVIHLHGSLAWLVLASSLGSILSTLVSGGILFYQHAWLLPSWRAFRKSRAAKILNLGLLFFVLQCAVTVGYTSDNIVISQVMGAAAVAAYAVPQKLFGFVTQVIAMALGPLWPAYGEAMTRGDVAWVKRAFWGSLWLVLAITIPSGILLVLGGPWILKVFFGKALHTSLPLLVVLAIWGVVNAVSMATSVLLNGAEVLKPQAVLMLIASPCNLLLSIFLTRRLGMMGVCLGSILTQLLIAFPAYAVWIPALFKRMAKAEGERSALEDDLISAGGA